MSTTRTALIFALTVAACSDGKLSAFVDPDGVGAAPSVPEPEVPSPSGGNGGSATPAEAGAPASGAGGSVPPATEPLLVDDFEDGNTLCLASDGYWYLVSDATGWNELRVEAAPDGARALHLRGGGFVEWGMALGLDIAGSAPVFDASAYRELRFRARAEPGSLNEIELHILESDLHFRATITLTSDWQEFALPLGTTVPTSGDPTRPLNLALVYGIQFFVLSDAAFDYWIDDVVLSP